MRRIDLASGLITTIAGNGKGGTLLTADPLTSELARPHGITVAPDGALVITDSYNDRILKILLPE